MHTLLNDEASDLKLIDVKFRPINEDRFHEIVLAEEGNTKVINVRLIRVVDDNPLTLAFAEKKLSDCVRDTIILVGLTGVLAELRAEEVRRRKENADADTIDHLKARIKRFTEIVRKHHRSRMLNRLLLYAARCQILDPLPRRSERSRDRAMIRRLAAREQEIEKELERLYEEDRRQQEAKQSVASIGGEKDEGSPPIPLIVINDETTEDATTPVVTQSTSDFYSQPRSHSSTFVTARTSDSAQKELASQPTQTANLGNQRILPSGRDLSTIRRGTTTQSYSLIFSRRPQKSSGDLFSTISTGGLPVSSLTDIESQGQQRHVSSVLQRRHSISSHHRAAPSVVLPASPQRLPLRSKGESTILVPSRLTDRARPVYTGMDNQQLSNHISIAMSETQDLDVERSAHNQVFQTVSSRAKQKSKECFSGPAPFFEVQTLPRAAGSTELRATDKSTANQKPRSKDGHTMNDQIRSTRYEGHSWDSVINILSSIDDLICDGDFGKHTHSLASAIKPNHYNEIELKSKSEVMSILQKNEIDEKESTVGLLHRRDDHPQSEFLKAEIELFLSVHSLMGCFIHHETRSEAKIVGKVWASYTGSAN
jgi:hypothetical protein